MATAAELSEVLAMLEDLLLELEVPFIVDQERALSEEGLPQPVEDRHSGSADWKFRIKDADAARRVLTIEERVATLIDLVEVAASATTEIEAVVLNVVDSVLVERAEQERIIQFSPPEEAVLRRETQESWRLPDASTLAERIEAARDVSQTLDALRTLLGLRRGLWLERVRDGRTFVENRDMG